MTDYALSLDDYERDNLLALIYAVSGHAGSSPMNAGNTGDWLMQIAAKLNPAGPRGGERGRPNRTAEEIVESAKRQADDGGPYYFDGAQWHAIADRKFAAALRLLASQGVSQERLAEMAAGATSA